MPQDHHQSIKDFTVGQKVRVVSTTEEFGHTIGRHPFDKDEGVTVTGVHLHGSCSNTAGTLSIEGYTNETENKPGWHPGAFGHLLFRPLDTADTTDAPAATDVVDRNIVLGDRVRITDKRIRIGWHPLGSGASSYVGKEGEVTRLASDSRFDTFGVVLDDDGHETSWTREALDVLDTDATPDDAPVTSEADVATTYDNPLDVPDDTLLNVGVRVVLDNVDDLQRVIADLRTDLDLEAATSRNRSDRVATLEAERTALTQAASDERRRLCTEIDGLKSDLSERQETVDLLLEERDTALHNLARTNREASQFEAALNYARQWLTYDQKLLLEGFIVGWLDGTSGDDD